MEEDFDFAEMIAEIVMDAEQKKAKQDAAQQAVERVSDESAGSTGVMSQTFWELTMRKGREKDGTRQASMIDVSSFYGCHR